MTRYCLLGEKLSHSLSPFIHNHLFCQSNLDAEYGLMEAELTDLPNAVDTLRAQFAGFNVTVPYKTEIIKYLDELSPCAKAVGAVNTVINKDGKLIGHNTDGTGFMKALEQGGVNLQGQKVLVLGAGGAARVIVYMLAKAGAQVCIHNRTPKRAQELIDDLNITGISLIEQTGLAGRWHLIVNTTSLGMYPENMEKTLLMPGQTQGADYVFDCVYNPLDTLFLKEFAKVGSTVIYGLDMLLYQAIDAQVLWQTGADLSDEAVMQLRTLLYERAREL